MLLIMVLSDCFCVSGLLGFFHLPYTVCLPYSLGVFASEGLTTLPLKSATVFLIGLKYN